MRIAYVGAVPPLQGGISQHGGRLVGALRDLGHDVSVVSWRTQYPGWLYPGGRQHAEGVSAPAGARHTLTWWNPVGWVRTGRGLRDHDLLVMPWITPLQAPALRAIAAAARVPLVVMVHNPLPHEPQPFVRSLTAWFFRHVDGIVAHARRSVADLRALVADLDARVVAHPPNLELTPTLLPPRPPLRLLFFGFVRPYKGVDVLLDAVAQLVSEALDVRLTIAGRVWGDPAPVEARIDALRLREVVEARLRYLPDAEVAELLASHHLVVAPYRSATQSGVVPLASAAGRATVVTRVGGLAEQVIDGETGTLAEPDDAASLAAAIRRADADLPDLSARAFASTPRWEDVASAVVEAGGS